MCYTSALTSDFFNHAVSTTCDLYGQHEYLEFSVNMVIKLSVVKCELSEPSGHLVHQPLAVDWSRQKLHCLFLAVK